MKTQSKAAQPQTPKLNPALKDLDVLVGKWNTEMSQMSFSEDKSAKVQGQATFEWIQDGAFLMMKIGTDGTAPNATELIGRDDSVDTYSVLYYDSRGVS